MDSTAAAPRQTASQQGGQTIAFQGMPGAYSDLSCRHAYPGWTTLPCPSCPPSRAQVGASEAALLGKLGSRPFQSGLEIVKVYDNGERSLH